MATKTSRSRTAPTAPQTWPASRLRFGRARTASAMTSALSPESSRFSTPMPSSRIQNSGSARRAIRSSAARVSGWGPGGTVGLVAWDLTLR